MKRIRRVLVASDCWQTFRKAVTGAIDLAKANRATLTIVHAYVPVVPKQDIEPGTRDRTDTDTRRWTERHLTKLAERARKFGVRAFSMLVINEPSRQIVRVARAISAGLVVVGTRGISTDACPVMTIRGAA